MTTLSTPHTSVATDATGDSASAIDHACQRMWLGGLPPMITEYAVLQLVRQFGTLTDFHFPVHRTGDARGSTVGYCFVAYDTMETAKRALKALNGLKFHGHILIARPAKPTHEELSLLQRANEEAARLRLIEETRLREAELAARLQQADDTEHISETEVPVLQTNPFKGQCPDASISEDSFLVCAPSSGPHGIPGYINPRGVSRKRGCVKNSAGCKLFMQKIESALKRLENSPIGGPALLQPASATQRSLVPAGILAKHPALSNTGVTRGRPSSVRSSSHLRRFGVRSHPRRL